MTPNNSHQIISNEIHDDDFLNLIENSLAIGSWELDLMSNNLKWSSVTKKIHEVPQDYIPDVNTAINFYKEGINRNKITLLLNQSLESRNSFDDEFIIITPSGKEKWIRAIGYPKFENDTCIAIRGVFQDIHDKTVKANATALKEKQLRTLFNHSITGIAILDLNGNWKKINPGICKMLGYTETEFLKSTYLQLTHPEDRLIGQKELKLMLSGDIDNFQTEKRYLHKEGFNVHCILSLTIVRDYNGIPEHFIANINNVSEIKDSKNKISELLDVSSKQNDRLLNFAHIVSHNLRSHGGNLDMLLKLKKEEYPNFTTNEYFPLIEKAVENLNETILNLNEVAIYNNYENKALEAINLSKYTDNALNSIKALSIKNHATINVKINPKTTIKGIPAYIDSILINFLTNAIKYRKLDINPIINIEAIRKDNKVILTIKDNGLGIDLDKYGDKLFGMYNMFHKHKEARGLGLFITKNQIEAIGGSVEVESTVDIGTKFSILFDYE
ncbi:PAS domain S-box protein [Olleya sp. ITB9]|uniref:sensor histidine kinase n=1 Tax=Olleya sp. ITB9 TaxID=1715648 RepID=UPI0006D1B6C5|nr:HAMP domain-containing sensor histidine kinase [Olleya sp. ITB9]